MSRFFRLLSALDSSLDQKMVLNSSKKALKQILLSLKKSVFKKWFSPEGKVENSPYLQHEPK